MAWHEHQSVFKGQSSDRFDDCCEVTDKTEQTHCLPGVECPEEKDCLLQTSALSKARRNRKEKKSGFYETGIGSIIS